MKELTQERLKELLSYDPDTGVFTWLKPSSTRLKQGDIAGTPHNKGYLVIRVNYQRYLAHRLAWFYMYGVWPSKFMDHINTDRSDNRISNLREATNAQNMQNGVLKKSNTSGFRGVSWHTKSNKWKAGIVINGKACHLGLFSSKEEASLVYNEKAKEVFGLFTPEYLF